MQPVCTFTNAMTDFEPAFRDRLHAAAPALHDILGRFAERRILVVGDLTLDEFLTGQVERISREAPVPIVRHESTRQVPGGGANAIYNLATLGARVIAVGVIGDDLQGQALCRILAEAGIDTSGIAVDRDRPTVTKSRISAHSRQSVTQQIVRIDRKSDLPLSAEVRAQLADRIRHFLPQVDAVVCSDYGEGVLVPEAIAAALEHPLTIVDAQKDPQRYRGATAFTPNLPEAELAVGYPIRASDRPDGAANLEQAAQDFLDRTAGKYVLITQGEEGMTLADRNGEMACIPAFNRTEVFDVTGAGDTVVAALTLAVASGASFWQAAVLGNLAASLVVRHFGTTTTTTTEMAIALDCLTSISSG